MHEIAFFLWLPKSFSHIKNLFDCYWCLLAIMDVHVTNIDWSKKLVVKYWWKIKSVSSDYEKEYRWIYSTNIVRNDMLDILYSPMVVKD